MSVKDIIIKKQTYYFSDDIISMKDFDLNNNKINKVIQKYSYLLYLIFDDQKELTIYSVNPLQIIFTNVKRIFEEIPNSKYLTLARINKSNGKIKKDMKKWGLKSEI